MEEGDKKMTEFKKRIQEYEKEYLEDLKRLVGIRSVRDLTTAGPGAPFGRGIRQAFDCFLEIGERFGLLAEDFNGYACHLAYGEQEEYAGVLGHLDVVDILCPEQWRTPPFELYQSPEGILYGRGVNDDKGPLLAGLYALRILKDMEVPLKRSIRVIAGGAEETTWECMEHYFAENPQPVMGFSPDGNFPVVNGEKGILKLSFLFPRGKERDGVCRLRSLRCRTVRNYVCAYMEAEYEINGEQKIQTFTGKESLSRNPQRGANALWKFAEYFSGYPMVQPDADRLLRFLRDCLTDDFYGRKSGLYAEDEQMGCTSICPTGVCMTPEGIYLYLDIRYPCSTDPERIRKWAQDWSGLYGFTWQAEEEKRLLYVPEDSELVTGLKDAYEKVTGERARVLTKGGASYARTLQNGVAFGAAFEHEVTNPHMPNECMSGGSLMKAMEIYCNALWNLTVEKRQLLPQ